MTFAYRMPSGSAAAPPHSKPLSFFLEPAQSVYYTSTGRAVIVCIIGWFVHLVLTVWAAALFGIALFGLSGMSTP